MVLLFFSFESLVSEFLVCIFESKNGDNNISLQGNSMKIGIVLYVKLLERKLC